MSMRKIHVLKIEDKYFKEVIAGTKTFEIRLNDRNYTVGDLIHFVNTDKKEFKNYDNNLFEITYIFSKSEFGLQNNYCVFSIRKINKN